MIILRYIGLLSLIIGVFMAGVWTGQQDDSRSPTISYTLLNPFYIQSDPELLPLPGQGNQPLGMIPEECVLLFQDGQLYRMMPGQGGLPGQGNGSPELLPLEPVPNVPGFPIPQQSPPEGLES